MLSLVEKLETTIIDDLALRCEIATHLGWKCELIGHAYGWRPPDKHQRPFALPPRWLTSLDAAVSLIPKYWFISEMTQCDSQGRCHVTLKYSLLSGLQAEGFGEDMEPALCVAALRAQGVL
jgi:hypothetical protein